MAVVVLVASSCTDFDDYNKVPTDVVLQLVGKDRDYFYRRMLDERKLKTDNDRA